MRRRIVPVVVTFVFVALLAMIAVPNFITAMNRSHQKQTMADLRTVATAIEAFATDVNHYDLDAFHGPNRVMDPTQFEALHSVRYSDLEHALVPKYIRKLPKIDGWGHEFEVRTGDYANGHARMYALRSPGSDGLVDRRPYKIGTISKFEDDVVLSLGNFIRYPEGI